jgi:hypothetical protein
MILCAFSLFYFTSTQNPALYPEAKKPVAALASILNLWLP